MSDSNATLFFAGLPTGPDVRKLETAFPDVLSMRGQVILHEQIEQILGHKRTESRYRTVFSAWRRKVERETGVVITGIGVAGGFRVLADGEQVSFGVRQRVSAARKIKRAWTVISAVDSNKLSAQESAVRDHEMRAAAKINAAMIEARKPSSAPAAITGGPKATPGSL